MIILALPLGGEQRLAVVDPQVNENGTVAVVEGYAVSDPDFLVNGRGTCGTRCTDSAGTGAGNHERY